MVQSLRFLPIVVILFLPVILSESTNERYTQETSFASSSSESEAFAQSYSWIETQAEKSIESSSSSSYSHASASSTSFSDSFTVLSQDDANNTSDCNNNGEHNCGKNEVFDICPAKCPERRCGVNAALILCQVPPQPGDPECEPGCRCIDGYLRNKNDICIPKHQCPKCNDQNEEYVCTSSCSSSRRKNCTSCECRCKHGFYRNDDGKCVAEEKCKKCGVNEVYDICPVLCPPKICGVDEAAIRCAAPPKPGDPNCKPGCRCIDGYYKNQKNICVPKDKCPKCRGKNEEYRCRYECTEKSCDDIDKIFICPIKNENCTYQCYCKSGFYRNDDGQCVTKKECRKCGLHEVYDTCPVLCPPKRCGVNEALIKCAAPPKPGDPNCKPGCRCIDGYYRNEKNVCIPKHQCPKCIGQNEEYCCRYKCSEKSCTDINKTSICPIKNETCIYQCYCKSGFYRNDDGQCVTKKECQKCGLHEVYDTCPVLCPPKRCGVNEALIKCAAPPKPGDPNCKPGCRCIDGYYRNEKNFCIPKHQCPKCIGQNEEYCCRYKCSEKSCTDINKTSICPIKNETCIYQCYCKSGFYRNDDGQCVTKKECQKCGLHEVYDTCPVLCPPKRCGVNEALIKCAAPPKPGDPNCKPGCRCIDGYYRNEKNFCIPKHQCPKCIGQNEEYCCRYKCSEKSCTDINKTSICPIKNETCIYQCYCKSGFYRNDDGQCVTKKECQKCGLHEVYDTCPVLCPPKRCGVNEALIKCAAPPKPGDPNCKPGCRCIDGYYRNEKNFCIPEHQCPKCIGQNEEYCCRYKCSEKSCTDINKTSICPIKNETCIYQCYCKSGFYRNDDGQCVTKKECQKCGLHEVYDTCPVLCPPKRCGVNEALIKCAAPPKPGDPNCKPGCRCIDGYYRNEKKFCIPKHQCPKCIGQNEEYRCRYKCSEKSCNDIDKTSICPIKNETCIYQCYCKSGFYRNDDGQCVTEEECPPPITCGLNEEYTSCANGGCGKFNCSRKDQPDICIRPLKCERGCRCKESYLRTKNGACVPVDQCPLTCSGPNEVVGCAITCPSQTCESINKTYPCPLQPKICFPACRCKPGYYRNKLNECVSKKNCQKCGENEVFDICPAKCPPRRCRIGPALILCRTPPKPGDPECDPGCRCIDGYLKNDNDVCIPKDQCPTCSSKNEEYRCDYPCSEQSCSNIDKISICPIKNKNCTSKCYCKPGYYRNDDGQCVTKNQCLTCSQPNEVVGCASTCPPQTCESINKTYHCPIKPLVCNPACRCKPGYYRNKYNECISEEECKKCGKHEVFDICPAKCPPRRCGVNPAIILCQKPPQPGDPECEPGCRCIDGYLKNEKDICVPKNHCPKCRGKNEEYRCRQWCFEKSCNDIDKILSICPLKDENCTYQCYCKPGYYRNDYGQCVTKNQCRPCSGPNEVVGCASTCPPQTCESIDRVYDCPVETLECIPACRCIPGFYRNKLNECISKENCLKCNGTNEYYSCRGACDNVCATLKKQNQTNCPIVNIQCNKMCYCEAGYARDDYNNCVPFNKCPKPPITCGANEVYTSCINGGCGKWNCSQVDQPDICIDPIKCIPGCRCKKSYLRTDSGICVPIDQCPRKCEGQNEVYSCGYSCPPQTCDSIGKRYNSCPLQNGTCTYKCRCKPGFYRDSDNKCISTEECKKCTGPHEHFACGGVCDNICATLKEQNQTHCLVVNKRCNEKCYCDKGYARDNNDICVPFNECPEHCNVNEEYVECRDSVCRPKNCSELGFPLPCFLQDSQNNCTEGPGCICKAGHVKNKKGQCIADTECPSCGGDPNAKTGSGTFCKTCNNYNKTAIACPLIFKFNGCDCKEGYVYETTLKKCLLPEQCLKCTNPNEIIGCKTTCPPQTCKSIGRQYKCVPPPEVCTPECRCKPGFYRNEITNECISKENCLKCNGSHEYYACGGACDNECATLKKQNQTICPIVNIKCNEMCYCEKGYARDINKNCIPFDECPINQCDENEEYVECRDSVCRPQNCSELGFPLPCYSRDPQCNCTEGPGCICKAGYVQNKKGKCISDTNCPACGGDPNAKPGSGTFCITCNNYNKKAVACSHIFKQNGCDCKPGYVYETVLKKCVLPEKCKRCNKNEIYVECPDILCRPLNCTDVGCPIACPAIAEGFECPSKPSCVCVEGYARSENGTCVPTEECPKNCGKNEVYVDKQDCSCRQTTCSELGTTLPCQVNGGPRDNCTEEPGCVCQAGSVRNDVGDCIPTKECPSCGGDENAQAGCGFRCKTCSNYNATFNVCPRIACVPNKCDCRPDYVFDKKLGRCVLPKDCTPECGLDEVFSNCSNGGCQRNTCAELALPCVCRDLAEGACEPGCLCRSGYLRADNNTCIPSDQCPKNDSQNDCAENDKETELLTGNDKFNAVFLYDTAKKNPGTSFIVSAFSVLFLLAQLALYATGAALEQLLVLLNLYSKSEIKCTIPPLLTAILRETNITFDVAQRIYANDKFPLSEEFKCDTENIFNSTAENFDASEPEEVAKNINDWVASQTNDLIQNLVPPSAINSNTVLILVNAIYFKGTWKKVFNPKLTEPKEFYISEDKNVTVQMMNQLGSFRYGVTTTTQSQVIEMPYKNENFTFVAILPPKSCGINDLLEELKNTTIQTLVENLKTTRVDISLPRYKIETSSDLKDTLNEANITAIFDPDSSGLEGITQSHQKLFVTAALQKALVDVNELGTEAAAATAVIINRAASVMPPLPPVEFNANHPFVYCILYRGTAIFGGLYAGPQ